MRIEQLHIQNFKCFEDQILDLDPRFTLLVGDNGAGKTTVLDALAVAAGGLARQSAGFDARQQREKYSLKGDSARVKSGRRSDAVRRVQARVHNCNRGDCQSQCSIGVGRSGEMVQGPPMPTQRPRLRSLKTISLATKMARTSLAL